jgi:2-haloacid dehalogenase
MAENPLQRVHTLTFDVFGTVLDLTGSIVPALNDFLKAKRSQVAASDLWAAWRARQRLEQFQDSLLLQGHSGYLETARRGLVYALEQHGVKANVAEVERVMRVYEELKPFDDAVKGLKKLADRYRLAALTNSNQWLLDHLCDNNIPVAFQQRISVDTAGHFKPHPSVYRTATRVLECEPAEIMMVASHSFDILGARACGFRGAYVNRYKLPYEDSSLRPDLTVSDFLELSRRLAAKVKRS